MRTKELAFTFTIKHRRNDMKRVGLVEKVEPVKVEPLKRKNLRRKEMVSNVRL